MANKTASKTSSKGTLLATDLHADHSFTPSARRGREDKVDQSLQMVRSEHQINAHPGIDRSRLGGFWKGYTMDMAGCSGDTVEFYPQLFKNLPFTATNLRNLREEVRELGSTKGKVQVLLDHMGDHLLVRKSQLHQATTLIWQTIQAQLINPLLSAEERQRLEAVAASMQSIIDAYNISVLTSRRQTVKGNVEANTRIAAAEAEVRLASLESRIAKGEKIDKSELFAQPLATAAKRSQRKTGRKTRR